MLSIFASASSKSKSVSRLVGETLRLSKGNAKWISGVECKGKERQDL